jgi:DNA-directed RNA polymerase subunit K/omega
MNFKNVKAERTTETRNTHEIESLGTGNLFETIVVLSKRSNQLSQDLKKELAEKMEEFVIPNDTLEEVFENREQIEISKFYERLAKPHSIAIKELEDDQIYFRHDEKVEELDLVIEPKAEVKAEAKATDDKSDNKSDNKADEKADEKAAEKKTEETAS